MSSNIKNWIKSNFPGVVRTYRALHPGSDAEPPAQDFGRAQNMEQLFTRVLHDNHWMDDQSASGRGSNLVQTAVLRRELASLLERLGVKSMLDAPCGDFNWMSKTDLKLDRYMGVDIVEEIVAANQRRYGSDTRRFEHLDVTKDPLPQMDLILCRDCLVHLSFADIKAALENFKASGSTYLLTTTFTERSRNKNIPTGGEWRPLNLMVAPFSLPAPRELLNEQCPEGNGAWADKSLGLWRLEDIELSDEDFPQ